MRKTKLKSGDHTALRVVMDDYERIYRAVMPDSQKARARDNDLSTLVAVTAMVLECGRPHEPLPLRTLKESIVMAYMLGLRDEEKT